MANARDPAGAERFQRFERLQEQARQEALWRDGRRPLGRNLEAGAALAKAATELREAFRGTGR